jgi:predicted extracellular nuclease
MKPFILALLFICTISFSVAQINLPNSTYTQDFTSLANSGTSSALPMGWLLSESGTNSNTTYTGGTGSSGTGDTYSFGVAGVNPVTDRAFGCLLSGSLVPIIGASFINTTGGTITALAITYTGEQWRMGSLNRTDSLDFQYSTSASSLTTGTWIDVNVLDFTAPTKTGTVGALDGNASANRSVKSFTITGLSIAPGSGFYIRWTDFNASGADDGLAIDDFSITPTSTGGASLSINDISMAEGNTGTIAYNFMVSLSAPAPAGGVSFNISTQNNSATEPSDYTLKSLTSQTITEGNTSYIFTVQVNGDATVEPDEDFFVNITNITGASVGDAQGKGSILNDDCTPTTSIAQVQGSGISSPILGSIVTLSGIVTGIKTNGYFIQASDTDTDSNPMTSEGIFLFTVGIPPAAAVIGNNVCVTGTVGEFVPSNDPNSPSQTELLNITSTILLSTGNPLPSPLIISNAETNPAGTIFQLEKFEGMRVKVNSLTAVSPTGGTVNETVITPSTSNGYFYGVLTGTNRPFREPGIQTPDPFPLGAPMAIPVFDANPELIGIASRGLFGSTAINVVTGAVITDIVGPLDFNNRAYTINIDLPSVSPLPIISNNSTTYTAVPVQTNEELTVASFNMERFFDNVNDPGIGEPVLSATAYNNRLNKISLAIRNVLRSPDVIGAIEVEKVEVLQAIAAKVNADAVTNGDPNPNYTAHLIEGNDPGGIDVGFLVKTSRVNVIDVTQYGKTTTYIDPNNGLPDLLNDRPPLVLNAAFNKPGCTTPYPFTVIVNHLRSLNGVDDPSDGNRVRTKRRAQAEFLASLIQNMQTINPAIRLLSIGDYNAFQFNDGYVDIIGTVKGTPTPASQVTLASDDLVNPDLVDLVESHTPDQRYSYSFEGNAQVLDHILVNQNVASKVSGFSIARFDADFPEVYRNDPNRPERISDHDVPVAYILFTDETAPTALCKAASVTLVNGTATLLPADINNGSTDECSTVTLSLSKSTFNCSTIGINTVTLTVKDASLNTSTCNAMVTVIGTIPMCSINVIPENNIFTGGVDTNIYLGYGPQKVMLSLHVMGGGPFTYQWTGSGLSCNTCASPEFAPGAEGDFNFSVLVTNASGCTTTCRVTIHVLDIRVPGSNDKKVFLCHAPPGNPTNTNTLEVNVNAVADHLSHPGDKLGKCEDVIVGLLVNHPHKKQVTRIVSIFPNPGSSSFSINMDEKKTTNPHSIKIIDIYGRLVSVKSAVIEFGSKFGTELSPGIYTIEISNGIERSVLKWMKL